MKDRRNISVCLASFLLAPAVLARPEPGAFLNRAAPDLPALIEQVRKDPEVYARFHKHFGMNKEELTSYLASLKPAKIEKSGSYVVYNVRDDEVIRSKVFNLKAGTIVYVDAVGRPALKKACGNPMLEGPKNLTATALLHEAPVAPEAEIKPIPVETAPETAPEILVAEELAVPPVEIVPPPVVPPVVPPPPVVTPPVETVVKPSFEAPTSLGFLLPLLAGSVIFSGGDNGSTVIPEPATMGGVAMMVGLYAAARSRRKNKAS
jgi:hypothetical protein